MWDNQKQKQKQKIDAYHRNKTKNVGLSIILAAGKETLSRASGLTTVQRLELCLGGFGLWA